MVSQEEIKSVIHVGKDEGTKSSPLHSQKESTTKDGLVCKTNSVKKKQKNKKKLKKKE
jgi:hypothetical protein